MFRRTLVSIVLILVLPLAVANVSVWIGKANALNWWEARTDSAELAPDAATTPEAVIQIYAARAFSWRGAFGVHTWIALKPEGADHYLRLEVIGWGVRHGNPAVRISRRTPDAYWFGSKPTILLDRRGDGVDALIADVLHAAKNYPYPNEYRVWPGPNSNTFTAEIARQVPALRLDLPANAIGKDYLPLGRFGAAAPSNTGYQLSILGLAGVMIGLEEGLEFNILGLTFGVDLNKPALKLPGLGRVGFGSS